MATWALLQTLFKPRLLVPAVRVPSIQHVDFGALKRAGYKGVVFDKDNCLTLPHRDRLVPRLQKAWQECIDTFGRSNIVIVSNASGTRDDPGGLEAESVAHHLGVPVLLHSIKKPGCSSAIVNYFKNKSPHVIAAFPTQLGTETSAASSGFSASQHSCIQPSELVLVGDRILTDVILANRLGALSIWTTGLWERELMPMRYFEYCLVGIVDIVNKCALSPTWKRNRVGTGEVEEPKQPTRTPQQLFTRVAPLSPPNTIIQIMRILGRSSIALFRSTRAATRATMRWWRRRQEQAAIDPSEGVMDVSKPPAKAPLHIRMISAPQRLFALLVQRLQKPLRLV